MKTKENGITLIALVITIIILIILAGVSINLILGENGLIEKAKETAIITTFTNYKEELELFKTNKLLENTENEQFYETTLTAGKNSLNYNTKKDNIGNIKSIIPDLLDDYIDNFEVIKGNLLFKSQNKKMLEIAQKAGIEINPYNIVNGELLSSDTNLMLMDNTGTLVIPDTITSIGEGAFSNVTGLKTIIIPYSVKQLKTNAFSSNTGIEKVVFQTKTNDDGYIEGCERIGERAFYLCSNLKEIELPQSLKYMESSAFYGTNLSSIKIPENVTVLSSFLFGWCSNLKEIIFLGNNITQICNQAFVGTSISTFKITDKVSDIHPYSFHKCTKLENLEVSNNNKNFSYSNGMLIKQEENKNSVVFLSIPYYSNATTLTIPEGTTNFELTTNSLKLKTLKIPSTLQVLETGNLPSSLTNIIVDSKNSNFIIKDNCLYSKDLITLFCCFSKSNQIEIEDNVEILGTSCFSCATNATTITLPESITTIGGNILGNTKVTSLKLGKKVKSIANWAFAYGLDNFSLEIDKENPYYTIESNVLYSKDKKILYRVIYRIRGTFQLDDKVEELDYRAFENQAEMKNIKLNNVIKKIGGQAFTGTSLESISIPNSITNIESNAFYNCNTLKKVSIDKTKNSITGSPWGLSIGERGIYWKN